MTGDDFASRARYRVMPQRYATVELPSGEEQKTWSDLFAKPIAAAINFGTGRERREAAQETASTTATFQIRRNTITATLTPADQLVFDGGSWDIIDAVRSKDFNRYMDITATRRTA
jgi:head-tail adaptor